MPKITSKSSLQLIYKLYTNAFLFSLNLVKSNFISWKENSYLLRHIPQFIIH